MLSYIT